MLPFLIHFIASFWHALFRLLRGIRDVLCNIFITVFSWHKTLIAEVQTISFASSEIILLLVLLDKILIVFDSTDEKKQKRKHIW